MLSSFKSPMDFAEPMVKIKLPDSTYNSISQSRLINDSNSILAMSTTWNTTQTFDSKGQPKDRDNDK